MSEYISLIGSEDVSRAGHNMKAAADEMSRAASSIEDSLYRFKQFMDDWLNRFEQIVKDSK